MEYAFETQPAYVQALALIRDIDEKLRYVNRNKNNRIPEMERLLESLMQVAAGVARAQAGNTPDFQAAHTRHALEHALTCVPLLGRIHQMELVTPNERDSFRQQLDAIVAELKTLIPDSGI